MLSDLNASICQTMTRDYKDFSLTFLDFAQVIKAQVGSKSEIVFKPAVEDDPQRRRPDISLAKRVLDWEPRIKLEQGIEKTIEYFKREISRNHLVEKDGQEEIANYQISNEV